MLAHEISEQTNKQFLGLPNISINPSGFNAAHQVLNRLFQGIPGARCRTT
jgi:hypothetical protein